MLPPVDGLDARRAVHVPHRGEIITLPPLRFEVLRADARQLHLLLVRREAPALADAVANA